MIFILILNLIKHRDATHFSIIYAYVLTGDVFNVTRNRERVTPIVNIW